MLLQLCRSSRDAVHRGTTLPAVLQRETEDEQEQLEVGSICYSSINQSINVEFITRTEVNDKNIESEAQKGR